jgi:predicted MPP superfamily phosphohydrolase
MDAEVNGIIIIIKKQPDLTGCTTCEVSNLDMKQLIPILILIAFLALVAGLNIYLAKRFTYYFNLESARPMYFLFASLTVFMFGGIAVFTNMTGILSNIIFSTAAVGLGFVLYLIFALILVDISHFVIKIPPLYYGLSAVCLALVISVYGLINARNLQTIEVDIAINGLKKEVSVMHLTDIHIGHWHGKKYLSRIVEKTNKNKIDYVFITGDLFDGRIRLNDENLKPLTRLNAPVYFVEGNHDGYTGAANIKARLKKIGIHVLEDVVINLDDIQLVGLNHMMADDNSFDMHAGENKSTIKSTLESMIIDPDIPSVLLHHSPDGIKYINEKGIDLYLAGHTHAGQLFPVTVLNEWIFAYNKGLHDFNGTKIYVSHGAGTFGPPMRIGTRSEITLITLKPENSEK